MTTVCFAESTRYGLRLYAYVLVWFAVGAAGGTLGAALLSPELRAWRGPGEAAVAPGVGGGVLVFLGLSVLTVGWLGTFLGPPIVGAIIETTGSYVSVFATGTVLAIGGTVTILLLSEPAVRAVN